jgi:uncharacterized membrane protein
MSRKTLLIALVASLAVNLFLVGAVAGGLVVGQRLRGERPPMERGGPAPQPLWRAADGLPQPQAQAYRQALRGAGPELRMAMRSARSERAEVWKSLAAEPFDPAAAKQRLAQVREREADARGRIEERIVDYAAGLSPQDRAALAKGLTAERPRRDGPPPR